MQAARFESVDDGDTRESKRYKNVKFPQLRYPIINTIKFQSISKHFTNQDTQKIPTKILKLQEKGTSLSIQLLNLKTSQQSSNENMSMSIFATSPVVGSPNQDPPKPEPQPDDPVSAVSKAKSFQMLMFKNYSTTEDKTPPSKTPLPFREAEHAVLSVG